MKIGRREFDTKNNTYIMGILNVTPDSFSDGGRTMSWMRRLGMRSSSSEKEPM